MAALTSYQALAQSAALLADIELLAYRDLKEGDLPLVAELLRGNRTALESARTFLGPKCAVPLRYEQSFFWENAEQTSHLRNLGHAFRAEAWLAAVRGDYRTAARIGLEILELANAFRRGGLVADLLIGIAISGAGIETLRRHRARFDAPTRRLVIRELNRLEIQREPSADIVARDHDWEVETGWQDNPCDFTQLEVSDPDECGLAEAEQRELFRMLQELADAPEDDRHQLYVDQDRYVLALMRLLVVDLALREWQVSCGSFPEDLSSLTPEPLTELPLDSYTDAPLIYSRSGGASFTLYSTGPKGYDGAGQIGPWASVLAGEADLFLDAGDYSPQCCLGPEARE